MFKKLKGEYRKSGMNIFQFIYWTVRGDIDDMKIKWKIAHESEKDRLYRSINHKLDRMIRGA